MPQQQIERFRMKDPRGLIDAAYADDQFLSYGGWGYFYTSTNDSGWTTPTQHPFPIFQAVYDTQDSQPYHLMPNLLNMMQIIQNHTEMVFEYHVPPSPTGKLCFPMCSNRYRDEPIRVLGHKSNSMRFRILYLRFLDAYFYQSIPFDSRLRFSIVYASSTFSHQHRLNFSDKRSYSL